MAFLFCLFFLTSFVESLIERGLLVLLTSPYMSNPWYGMAKIDSVGDRLVVPQRVSRRIYVSLPTLDFSLGPSSIRVP